MTLVKRQPHAPDPLLGVLYWLPLYPKRHPKSWQCPPRSCHLYPHLSDPSSYSSTWKAPGIFPFMIFTPITSYIWDALQILATMLPPILQVSIQRLLFFWRGEGFLIALCKCVPEGKFECPTYDEVKQMETSEFGAERGLLWGQTRRMGGLCSKNLNSLKGFSKAFLKRRWGRGIPGFIICPCTSLWLVDDDQSLGSRRLGARCSWSLSKTFFYFLQKNSGIYIGYYYLGGASLVAQW